jgi:hypothetical protein
MKTQLKTFVLLFAGSLFFATDAYSQLSFGTDVYSRYVWRGADFGNSPSIQPDINFTAGNFEIGTWAAFATTGNPAGTEVDFYSSYTFATEAGDFSLAVTDYTFPDDPTGNYFSSESHFIELGAGYSGTESFPISIFTGVFVTNDDDYSVYTEVGYEIGEVALFMGFTPSESQLYGTTKAGIINTGFSVSKDIQISETFSIGLNSSVIANPYSDNLFFLIGFGL